MPAAVDRDIFAAINVCQFEFKTNFARKRFAVKLHFERTS